MRGRSPALFSAGQEEARAADSATGLSDVPASAAGRDGTHVAAAAEQAETVAQAAHHVAQNGYRKVEYLAGALEPQASALRDCWADAIHDEVLADVLGYSGEAPDAADLAASGRMTAMRSAPVSR